MLNSLKKVKLWYSSAFFTSFKNIIPAIVSDSLISWVAYCWLELLKNTTWGPKRLLCPNGVPKLTFHLFSTRYGHLELEFSASIDICAAPCLWGHYSSSVISCGTIIWWTWIQNELYSLDHSCSNLTRFVRIVSWSDPGLRYNLLWSLFLLVIYCIEVMLFLHFHDK